MMRKFIIMWTVIYAVKLTVVRSASFNSLVIALVLRFIYLRSIFDRLLAPFCTCNLWSKT